MCISVNLLLDDLAHRVFAEEGGGVELVVVDVHECCMLRTDAGNDVIKNQGAACALTAFNHELIAVFDAPFFAVFRGDVAVAHSDDSTFFKLNLSFRADDRAAGRALEVSAQTDRAVKAERARVGEAELYLVDIAARAENGQLRLALRADDGDLLIGCKLIRLREHLLDLKLEALAEKHLKRLLSEMAVFA